jgi:hypothetical protein
MVFDEISECFMIRGLSTLIMRSQKVLQYRNTMTRDQVEDIDAIL